MGVYADTEKDDGSGPFLFYLPTLRKATGDFAEDNKLGHGGFGAVYKVYYIENCYTSCN